MSRRRKGKRDGAVFRGSSNPQAMKRARSTIVELEQPYTLSPSQAPRLFLSDCDADDPSAITEFYPVDKDTPEEVLTPLNMANGYSQPSCVVPEYGPSKLDFLSMKKAEIRALKFDLLDTLRKIEWQRTPLAAKASLRDAPLSSDQLRSSAPQFPKQSPKDSQQKDKFVMDLAGHTPLRELVKGGIPLAHGSMEILLEALAETKVPLLRATWYLKVSFLNQNQRRRRKNKSYEDEFFTKFLSDKVMKLAKAGVDEPSHAVLLEKFQYISRLMRWAYCEKLLDRRTMISGLITALRKYDRVDPNGLMLATTMQYVKDILLYPDLVLELLHYCYKVRQYYEAYLTNQLPSPNPSPGGASRARHASNVVSLAQNVSFRLKHLRVCTILERMLAHDPVLVVSFSKWGDVRILPQSAHDRTPSGDGPHQKHSPNVPHHEQRHRDGAPSPPLERCRRHVEEGRMALSLLDRLTPSSLTIQARVVQHLERFDELPHKNVEALRKDLFPPRVDAADAHETVVLLCEWALRDSIESDGRKAMGDVEHTTRSTTPLHSFQIRALVVASVLRKASTHFDEATSSDVIHHAALSVLCSAPRGVGFTALMYMFGELFRQKVVSHERYMRRLIADGLLPQDAHPQRAGKEDVCAHNQRCLLHLPIYGKESAHTKRRVALWGLDSSKHTQDKRRQLMLRYHLRPYLNDGDEEGPFSLGESELSLRESASDPPKVSPGDHSSMSRLVGELSRYSVGLLSQWMSRCIHRAHVQSKSISAGQLDAVASVLMGCNDSVSLVGVLRAVLRAPCTSAEVARVAMLKLSDCLPTLEAMGRVAESMHAVWDAHATRALPGALELVARWAGFHWASAAVQGMAKRSGAMEHVMRNDHAREAFERAKREANQPKVSTTTTTTNQSSAAVVGTVVRVPQKGESDGGKAQEEMASALHSMTKWSVNETAERIHCILGTLGDREDERDELLRVFSGTLLCTIAKDPIAAPPLHARLLEHLEQYIPMFLLRRVLFPALQNKEHVKGDIGIAQVFVDLEIFSPSMLDLRVASLRGEDALYDALVHLVGTLLSKYAGQSDWENAAMDALLPTLNSIVALTSASASTRSEASASSALRSMMRVQRVLRCVLQLLGILARSGRLREWRSTNASWSVDDLADALLRVLALPCVVAEEPHTAKAVDSFRIAVWTLRKVIYGAHNPEGDKPAKNVSSTSANASKRVKYHEQDRLLSGTRGIPQEARRKEMKKKLQKTYKSHVLPNLTAHQRREVESIIPMISSPPKTHSIIAPPLLQIDNPWQVLEDFNDNVLTLDKLKASTPTPRRPLRYAGMAFPDDEAL